MSTPQKKVNPIPADYPGITPYLSVKGAAEAIEFYKKAFGAIEMMRLANPDGTLSRRFVRVGAEAGGKIEILSGLGPGDRVALPTEVSR